MIETQVYFVGSGPGDPDLLTLKARQLIEVADVILYDYLVHPSCILAAKSDVILECVGKKKGAHSKTQNDINQLILAYTLENKMVVRLKGGDPSVFGRLGEEMSWCKAHQITYEIVPGISSATAAPIYAGIPVTHREKSRSVAFLTGTLQSGDAASEELIPDADTIVILMSVSHLSSLVDALKARPRFSGETPIVVISRGTLPDQKNVVGTLDTVLEVLNEQPVDSPALCVVGEVVSCHETLNWKTKHDSKMPRLLWYRAKGSDPLGHRMALALGYESIWVPACDFESLKPNALEFQGNASLITDIVFTSPRTVLFFKEACLEHGLDFRSFSNAQFVSVGPATTAELARYGIRVDHEVTPNRSEGVCQYYQGSLEGRILLLPGAKEASSIIETHCKTLGASVIKWSLYQKKWLDQHLKLVLPKAQDCLIIGSTEIAKRAVDLGLFEDIPLHLICLGPATSNAIPDHPLQTKHIVDAVTPENILKELHEISYAIINPLNERESKSWRIG